jgi:hypothetical protein
MFIKGDGRLTPQRPSCEPWTSCSFAKCRRRMFSSARTLTSPSGHLPVYLAQNTDTLALTTARLLDRDALGEIARLIHVAT